MMVRLFRRTYGASPLHLLAMIVSLALVGYAAYFLVASMTLRVVIWFVGAAVGHDVILVPLYAVADRSLTGIWRRTSRADEAAVPWLNHVRFPAAISLLLLMVFWPEISRRRTALQGNSDLTTHPYFAHWLLVSGILFAISAIGYAFRLRRHGHEPRVAQSALQP